MVKNTRVYVKIINISSKYLWYRSCLGAIFSCHEFINNITYEYQLEENEYNRKRMEEYNLPEKDHLLKGETLYNIVIGDSIVCFLKIKELAEHIKAENENKNH